MIEQARTPSTPAPALARFVSDVERSIGLDETELLARVVPAMKELVARDDWLPAQYAKPHPQYYQQYLLHADPAGRFSVVSFVWGPGQRTPIHDHGTWGVIGMLRGAEVGQAFEVQDGQIRPGAEERLNPGETAVVSPALGDIHVVRNAYEDRVSISIHVYGVDIGQQRRHVFDPATGARKEFVSGYANA